MNGAADKLKINTGKTLIKGMRNQWDPLTHPFNTVPCYTAQTVKIAHSARKRLMHLDVTHLLTMYLAKKELLRQIICTDFSNPPSSNNKGGLLKVLLILHPLSLILVHC